MQLFQGEVQFLTGGEEHEELHAPVLCLFGHRDRNIDLGPMMTQFRSDVFFKLQVREPYTAADRVGIPDRRLLLMIAFELWLAQVRMEETKALPHCFALDLFGGAFFLWWVFVS